MFDDEALYGPVNSYAARTERVQFPMYFSRMSLVLTFGYAICEMGSKGSVPDVLQQNVISVDIWLCNLWDGFKGFSSWCISAECH